VEQNYSYDPGMAYIQSLGYSQGYQNTLGNKSPTTVTTSSFNFGGKKKPTLGGN